MPCAWEPRIMRIMPASDAGHQHKAMPVTPLTGLSRSEVGGLAVEGAVARDTAGGRP